jgi:hypothetical protein
LAAFAGLVAFLGVVLSIRETRRAASSERNRELREIISDRYTQAVTLLGSPIQELRLGGIYALERIAIDSPADHRTVVEVLSAYVRSRSTGLSEDHVGFVDSAGSAAPIESNIRPQTDIQAAVTVLGRLPVTPGVLRADLMGADLRRVSLVEANLSEAQLSRANLMQAVLRDVNLARANLSDANLSQADLGGASLAGAVMKGADVSRADLTGADLSRIDASNANLNLANLQGARLIEANLSGANLSGAHVSDAVLLNARIFGASLDGIKGLGQEELEHVHGNLSTVLPPGLHPATTWRVDDDERE